MAGVAARLARALHKSNISQLVWLALRGTMMTLRVAALRAVAAILPARLLVVAVVSMAILAIGGVMLGRLRLRPAGTPVGGRDGHSDQPLDVTQIGPLFVIAERNRHAFGPGARGTANTVDIALRNVR